MIRKKILIVDDQPEMRQLVSFTLGYSNFELSQASTAEKALIYVRENKIDLIILDIMMPGPMNGFQLCRLLKDDPQYEAIKIILLSARDQPADLEEGIKVKSDAYLVKPFSPVSLQKKVIELLRKV
ncbi:MAG: response regulator [Methylovulum sp.]|nr:response regulator [Methylovulum sp.]MCF7997754.1 response regulator [Methylovulum sp.]